MVYTSQIISGYHLEAVTAYLMSLSCAVLGLLLAGIVGGTQAYDVSLPLKVRSPVRLWYNSVVFCVSPSLAESY